MVPRPAEVVRQRLTALMVLRLIAIGLALLPLWPLGAWLSEGLRDGDWWDIEYYIGHFVGAGLLVVPAVAIALLSRRLSRWCVRVRSWTACPRCSYRLEGLSEPRCPECGLALGREFLLAEPLPPDAWPSEAVLLARRRGRVANIFRLLGALSLIIAAMGIVGSIVTWVVTFANEPGLLALVVQQAIWAVMYGIVGAFFLVRTERLSRFVVPAPASHRPVPAPAANPPATPTADLPARPGPENPGPALPTPPAGERP